MYPLDLVKTRFQVNHGTQKVSVLSSLRSIVQAEGYLSMFVSLMVKCGVSLPRYHIANICRGSEACSEIYVKRAVQEAAHKQWVRLHVLA